MHDRIDLSTASNIYSSNIHINGHTITVLFADDVVYAPGMRPFALDGRTDREALEALAEHYAGKSEEHFRHYL